MSGRRVQRSGRHPRAFLPFFAGAAVFAIIEVPLWAARYLGLAPGCAFCDPFARHGHEMLFGYALAVIGGFLFTRISRPALAVAFAAWLAGRMVMIADPPASWAIAAVALAYPACVLVLAGLPFLRATRTAHNAVFAPILGAFTLAELLYQLGALGRLPGGERAGVMLAFGLVALLMLVMGGRVIPAATAGAIRGKGGFLAQRVQLPLEWLGIGGVAVGTLLEAAGAAPLVAGLAFALAGAAALARLARWRGWQVIDRAELWTLHVGYAWLGGGLLLAGAARLGAPPAFADALHAVTVGALGTLTLSMMARTALQRSGRPTALPRPAVAAVVVVGLAAGARLLAALDPRPLWMAIAAALWAAAFLIFLAWLARAIRSPATVTKNS